MTTTSAWTPPAPTTHLGDVPLFAEADCTVTAAPVVGHPGKYVVWVGGGMVTVHGDLETLERLGREWVAAVAGLTAADDPCAAAETAVVA